MENETFWVAGDRVKVRQDKLTGAEALDAIADGYCVAFNAVDTESLAAALKAGPLGLKVVKVERIIEPSPTSAYEHVGSFLAWTEL